MYNYSEAGYSYGKPSAPLGEVTLCTIRGLIAGDDCRVTDKREPFFGRCEPA